MPPPQEYVVLQSQANDLVSSVGKFLVEATQGQNQDEDSASSRQLIDEQLQRFWRQYGLIRGSTDEALTVAVLALTKSGKSTLLNALTSSECLPMNNVPETARICKILHSAGAGEAWLQETGNVPPVRGERAVRARLAQLNSKLRAHSHAEVGEDHVLLVHAPIAALREYDGSGLPSLALLDTPGPNEAGEEGLRHQVDRLLDSVDAVVYVLDYTKLKTAEEADMFRRLKQINPQLVKRLSQRLFFVVNKADTSDVSEGMDADETREYVASLVTQQLAGEGFRLQPEQVVLVSARNALLSRLILSGKASDDVTKRFSRLAFGMASQSRALPSAEQVQAAARSLLMSSGVLDLEAQVLTFLYAHSAGVKLMATLDNVSRLLSEMSNVALSCRACLHTNVASLQAQSADLSTKLQATLGTFEDVILGTETLQSEVTDEIRAHLQSLRVRLFNHILQTLEAADVPGLSSRPAPPRAPRHWQALRDKFVSMFTTSTLNGVAAAKSRSREELQKTLLELHDGLMAQIQVEVGEFWCVLEACTNARHAALVKQLNTTLAELGRQVEEAVCTGLNVVLQPVDISMPTPSATQFHSDLNQLISKGIYQSQEKHLRVGQRQYEERVLRWRHGVCQWGAYWESVPRTRTVVETYDVTTYELMPNNISSHFLELVDSAIETTSNALSSYVRTFVRSQLDAARSSIKEYSERYTSAMTAALDASQRGAEARAVALANVERHLAGLGELSQRTVELQGRTEPLVPQLQDAVAYDELSDDDGTYAAFAADTLPEAAAEAVVPAAQHAAPAGPTLDSITPACTAATTAAPAIDYTRFEGVSDSSDDEDDVPVTMRFRAHAANKLPLAVDQQTGRNVADSCESKPDGSAPESDSNVLELTQRLCFTDAQASHTRTMVIEIDSEADSKCDGDVAQRRGFTTQEVPALTHNSGSDSGDAQQQSIGIQHSNSAQQAGDRAVPVHRQRGSSDDGSDGSDDGSKDGSGLPSLVYSDTDVDTQSSVSDEDISVASEGSEDNTFEGSEDSNVSTGSVLSESAPFLPRAGSVVVADGSLQYDDSISVGDSVSIGGNVSFGGSFMSSFDSPHLPLPPVLAPLTLASESAAPAARALVPATAASASGTPSAATEVDVTPVAEPGDASPAVAQDNSAAPLPRQVAPANIDGGDADSAPATAPAQPDETRGGSVSFHEDVLVILPEAAADRTDGGSAAPDDSATQYFDAIGGRFDYATGFVRAMSTSAMLAAAEEAAADEWTLLDENGSSASEGGDSSTPSTP